MRRDIHPPYGPVVFQDMHTGTTYLTRSTCTSDATIELDGQTYPLVTIEVSASSHPFWTGRQNLLDSEGRVEAFRRRYGA